ncbi:MAG: prepilin peptidase [Puniceicoccales bacterium]|jgi:leader peptidase (prepilin peptidase)/N-methyltransferase|nr:prepilin peptidase [Puniceicoccales bacterium]
MPTDALTLLNTQFPWFPATCAGIFGAIVGSFLNVCIYRIPKGQSLLHPGSHCACGAPIPWHRNLPILAWLLLRGKAPCCGQSFSARYPLVETLTAALFAICWATLPWQQAVPGLVLVALLIVLAFIDLDSMLLPDTLNISLAATGLALSVLLPGLHGETGGRLWIINSMNALGASLTGILIGAGLVYWIRLISSACAGREAMGEGDIILLGGIGAFCSWQGALFALFGGALIGTIILLPLLFAKALFRNRGDATASKKRAAATSLASCEGDELPVGDETLGLSVPFGPWLATGAVAWFLFFRTPMAQQIEPLKTLLMDNAVAR